MQDYDNAVDTGKAVIVLHNYALQNCNQRRYMDTSSIIQEDSEGNLSSASWEQEVLHSLDPMDWLCGNRSGDKSARRQRDFLANAFMTDEMVSWQFKQAFGTK